MMDRWTPVAALAASLLASGAQAAGMPATKAAAMAAGAEPLSADEIAAALVGHTGDYRMAEGYDVWLHYGEGNALTGDRQDGEWAGRGFYAITDADRLCISWAEGNPGRLRCLDVVEHDGTIAKYNADGSINGHYLELEAGRTF
jgi:hypothetical protein